MPGPSASPAMEPPPAVTLAGAVVVESDRIERRDLHLAGGRVVAVPASGAAVLDARPFFVFPGLLNAHDHLHLNAVPAPRPTAIAANAYEWIREFQPLFDEPAVRRALAVPAAVRAAHGGWKNLLAGATTVAHHDPWLPVFAEPEFPVRVVAGYGWSHSLGLADGYGPPVAESHAATPRGRPWFIHLAEGTDARAAGELDALERIGALDERTVLVHGVALSRRDAERVLAARAAVVWCPSSNLALLGATLDPSPYAAAGRLALGTDSRLSGSRDLLAELAVARSAGGLPARDLVRIVTRDAAAVLCEEDAGGLSPGMRADLVLLRAGGDPYEALVAATRGALGAVVRAGRPAVAHPRFADWFARAGIPARRARLDGEEKLVAPLSLEAAALEPGLTIF